MPSPSEHQAQAAKNEQAHDAIRRSQHDLPDWEITTTFYTAVHEIRAFLNRKEPRYRREKLHYSDYDKILRSQAYGEEDLADTFEQLKGWSQASRYQCKTVAWNTGKIDVSRDALARIRRRLTRLHQQLDEANVPSEGL